MICILIILRSPQFPGGRLRPVIAWFLRLAAGWPSYGKTHENSTAKSCTRYAAPCWLLESVQLISAAGGLLYGLLFTGLVPVGQVSFDTFSSCTVPLMTSNCCDISTFICIIRCCRSARIWMNCCCRPGNISWNIPFTSPSVESLCSSAFSFALRLCGGVSPLIGVGTGVGGARFGVGAVLVMGVLQVLSVCFEC